MSKTTFAKDWSDVYNKANVVFSKAIQTLNKTTDPKEKLGPTFKLILDDANASKAAKEWADCLVQLDKIEMTGAAPGKDNFIQFKEVLKKAETVQKQYVSDIVSTLNAKPTVKKNGFNLPTPMKEAQPDTYRQLKIMEAEVKAIYSRAATILENAVNSAKIIKLIEEKEAIKKKTKVEDLPALNEEYALKVLQNNFIPHFKSAMSKGAAAIQKIKADPTVVTYNKQMEDGGRDISQQLINLGKIKADPKFKSTALAKKLADPSALSKALIEFGNGAKRKIPDNTSQQTVNDLLKEFSGLYKQALTTYADVISGKFKG